MYNCFLDLVSSRGAVPLSILAFNRGEIEWKLNVEFASRAVKTYIVGGFI